MSPNVNKRFASSLVVMIMMISVEHAAVQIPCLVTGLSPLLDPRQQQMLLDEAKDDDYA